MLKLKRFNSKIQNFGQTSLSSLWIEFCKIRPTVVTNELQQCFTLHMKFYLAETILTLFFMRFNIFNNKSNTTLKCQMSWHMRIALHPMTFAMSSGCYLQDMHVGPHVLNGDALHWKGNFPTTWCPLSGLAKTLIIHLSLPWR